MTRGSKHDISKLELFLTHRTALIDYAMPIVGGRAQAEDIVQEAYVRFAAARTHRADARVAQPLGYLYRIVRNLAVDCSRRLAVERRTADIELFRQLPLPVPSPERVALYKDELRIVAAALQELPERTRRAFELHRIGGMTLQQVGRELGISVGLAHHLVRDAMTHCAEKLGDLDP